MALVSNKQARERADAPVKTFTFEGQTFDLCWRETHVLVCSLDDGQTAERIAAHLGTCAKHATNKHQPVSWKTFSIVPLPDA